MVARIVPRDLRYAARGLRRGRSFFALSVFSLGIGIGLSTATFAYVEASLNPKLPYADAAQLTFAQLDVARWQRSPRQRDLIDAIRALPFVEGVTQLNYETRKELRGNGLGGRPNVSRFALNFFEVTGVRPQLGRWPTADEARVGSAAVVSANLWSRGFLNRGQIGDAHLTVDGLTVPIVGVLPRDMFLGTDVWIPYPSDTFLDSAGIGGAPAIVRLRKGVTRAAINGQLATAAARLQAMYVADPRGRPYLLSLHSYLFAGQRPGEKELSLIGLALGILLIAASNVAALALARAYARRRDLALRIALGASRAAIARELFGEIGVISVFGALLGAACSIALIGMLTLMTPAELLGNGAVYGVRLPVLTPHLFIYVLIGLIVSVAIAGGIPAWRASHVDPAGPLKDNAGTTTGRTKSEFRILLVGELAVAMTLITVTSLLLLSARNLASFDFGFDLRKPVEARVSFVLPDDRPPTAERNYASALARARATPGVAMASTFMPTGFIARTIVSRPSRGADHTIEPDGQIYDAGPDAFRTLGITMLEGRDFTDGDRASGDAVSLAERAARGLFPRRKAIGSTL
ncbi:MAG: ABC transporter permease, partial [Gemmatimonadales bacterium]